MLIQRILSCGIILLMSATAWAENEATTQSATPQPAAAPLRSPRQRAIPPAAQALLDQVTAAYQDAKGLSITGKLSLDFDAGGDQKHDSSDFTASFAAPNQFRHEVKDDVLIVSTGEKAYAYLPAKNEYVVVDAPKDRTPMKDFSQPIAELLGSQNPVLLMAILSDPAQVLIGGASNVAVGDDVKLADTSYNAMTFEKNDRSYRVLIDPSTHFVRQIRIDRKAEIEKKGVENVKTVDVTFDYLSTKAETPAADLFAWTPPRDATIAKEDAPDGDMAAATALESKPAPDFKLTAIDGSTVALADLKGHVAVLDFWATWCGPCVESLPHLDKMNSELAGKGLKLYAIDLEEPKTQVQKFIITQKLTLPVLLDSDGAIGKKYLANAIPETVIIGKDGVVQKVIVGFQGEEVVRQAVDEAMKK